MTAEDYLNEELNGCYQTYTDDGITLISGIEHSEMCEIMDRYKQLSIPLVIQRFMNSEIKIKVDEPAKKHLLKHIFIECGFKVEESKHTFEKGRFFWVEEGLFSSETRHLKNSMALIRRNRGKETVNLSDLNIVLWI